MEHNQTLELRHKQQIASEPERRFFPSETRAIREDGGDMVIQGVGAIFNRYTNMGWYAEVILPGFFDDIKDDRCACLFNHDSNLVLGRKKNETLTLDYNQDGLKYRSVAPKSREDVYELIERGDVYESSFAFTTAESRWSEIDRSLLVGKLSETDLDQLSWNGKISVRELVKGRELFDVSPVTYAAYEGTTTSTEVAKRSFEAWKAADKSSNKPEEDQDGWADFFEAAAQFVK